MKATDLDPPDLFRAFADATRLRLLNLLLEREICVCDLCAILGEIQPKVSRHLAILRRADLVRVRRDGKRKFYALSKNGSPLQQKLFRCVRSCLAEFEVLAADRQRLESMHASLHRPPRTGEARGRH
jgi:DNA-binding transcriptional ArsR family regulator